MLGLHGFAPGDGTFSYVAEDHICLKDRVIIDKELNDVIEIDPEYWYRKYGVPAPKGGPKLKASPVAQLADRLSAMQGDMQALRDLIAEQNRLRTKDDRPLPADPKPRRGFFG